MIAKVLRTIAMLGMLGTLAACGGGGAGGGGATGGVGGGGGGPGGGTTAAATLTLVLTDAVGNAITHVSSTQSGTAVATVRDASGNAVAGALVTFSTDAQFGTFDPASGAALTDASGRAMVTLRPGTSDGAAQLSATGVFRSGGVDVSVSNAINYSSTAGVGAAPSVTVSAPVFGVNPLSAYGTTSVTVTVAGASTPLLVSFNSVCAQLNRASITTQAATIDGIATASYRDNGCAGTDTITATVMSGVSNSATLVIQAPTVGSIQFLSANPNNIVLQGTGGAGRQETSTVRFRVLDQGGNPIARSVNFALTTNVGGLALTNVTAQSDALTGEVQTTVNAGTIPTPVRVQATVAGTNITTLSDQLSISSGYPDQAHFSLSVSTFNIEGWDYDGETTALTVRLADHFSNPVPDGTVVNFIAEGGQIGGTCSTTGSLCTVNFTSQALRPVDGRVSVLAYAIGNEAFTDTDGNGLVNTHAERVDANGFSTDLPEAWIDYNENSLRDAGEPFVDFNNNGSYDGPDGLYTGVLCQGDASLCSSARIPPRTTLHIFNQAVIVLSGSAARIDFVDASLNPIAGVDLGGCASPQAERTVYALIRDDRNNPMPAGTLVTATSNNGAVVQGASQLVPNSSARFIAQPELPFLYRFDIRNDASGTPCTDPTATGILRVTVRTPKNVSTIASLPVTN